MPFPKLSELTEKVLNRDINQFYEISEKLITQQDLVTLENRALEIILSSVSYIQRHEGKQINVSTLANIETFCERMEKIRSSHLFQNQQVSVSLSLLNLEVITFKEIQQKN